MTRIAMASSDPQGHPQDPAQRSSQSPPRLPSRLSAQQHPDPAEKIQPLPPIVPKRDEDPDLPTTAETPSAEEEQAQAGALEYSESIDVGDPEEDQGVVDGHLDNVSRLYMSRFTQVRVSTA